jgi:hypothetical protein
LIIPVNGTMMASMRHSRDFLVAFTLWCLSTGLAFGADKVPKLPKGTKVHSGQAFDIYVVLKEAKPVATSGSILNIFETTVVVHHTRKHGRQLKGGRLEAIDADLLDPSMWQVGDFDSDGLDDYRSVAQITKKGCRIWATQTWLPDRERFTFSAKIAYQTDSNGKPLKSCQ